MHHNYQTIVNLFAGLKPLCLAFNPSEDHLVSSLKLRLADLTNMPVDAQRITTIGGRPLRDDAPLFDPEDTEGPVTFNLSLRLLGGKGGFGSMLRAQGGRMASQKTTNFEACRDLSGRRLKTVNEAKKLADLLERQPELEKARQERVQRKIEKGMREPPQKKHRFDDHKFLEDREEVIDGVKNAVAFAMKKGKKKVESEDEEDEDEDENEVAFVGYWGEEIDEDEDEDEDEEEEEEERDQEEEKEVAVTVDEVDKGKKKETKKRKERA